MFTSHTLIELLAHRAMQQAHRCAYTFLPEGESEEVRVTYGELEERVRSVGAALAKMGASGERVMLLFPAGLDYVAAFFGCLYAGAVAVPAYPPRPNRSLDRIESIADDSQAVIALTTSQSLSKAKTFVAESPVLSKLQWLSLKELEAERPGNWGPTFPDPNALAYLQYTSGSTAQPKGVMISHANVLNNAAYIHHGFEHTPESISLSWLPHFHDMGLIDGIIVPLFGGFHGYLMPPAAFLQKPLRWLQAVTRLSITHTGGPNFAYELCLRRIGHEELNELDLRTWSVAYNGAEPVRPQTLERFASTFASCGFRPEVFYPAYGLAEATLKVTGGRKSSLPARCALSAEALQHHRLVEVAETDPDARVLVGCGYVDADTRVEIVDPESHTVCGELNVGEIWVSSPSVAGGYWNRPDETEQTFHAYLADTGDGPFLRTGDLGFLHDGELFITGRLKDVIITRGLNHYPQDIERSMEESHPALRPGCGAAFSIDAGGEERLVLVQEVERAPEASHEEIIMAVLRAVGQDHEVQAHAIVLVKPHSIPKTSSGKIQRHLCRQRYLEGSLEVVAEWREATPEDRSVQAGTPRREPAEIESWLATRIATRLGLRYAEPDVDTPIARFGLDSLTAIELTHELETELSLRLPMASLLQDFSIAQLAARLAADAGVDGHLAYEPLADPADEYPLSYGQRAMWFLYRLAPESPAYNIPVAVRIPGELDSAAFRHAFESLIARHASFRATFHESPDGGGPVQRISEQAAFDFAELDASDWSEAQLRAHLLSEAHKHFDLGTGPVLRVTLLERSAHERVLLLVVHHIVADFWSLATMMRELAAFYDAARDGQSPSLPALALEYTDYVRLQSRAIEGQQGERLAAFWEKQFESEPPKLDLPTDRPRPPVQTFVGRSHTIRLDADLTQWIKDFGRARGATLYMTLLAAFQVLLHRYTGQTDFAIGSPSSGRNHHKLTDVVGYFVNPLVLRADLAGHPTFEELLDQVRRRVLAAFEHQDFPFPVLVERLRPTRDPSYSPLFQAMFILQKAHSRSVAGMAALALGEAGSRVELGGLTLESISLDQRVAQFDLTLMMVEEDEGLAASWQYNTDLFDAPTIARMAAHFKTTLAKLINDPSLPVSQLPLLSAAEQQQLLVDWNATTAPFFDEACIHELIEQQTRRTPGAVALVFEGEQLTYSELDEKANQLARYLRARGVGAETRVGVLLERSIQLVVALLGVLKAGGAYVPLDSEYPGERLSFMAEDASLALVITGERLAQRAREWGLAVVNLDGQWAEVARESRDQLTPVAGPDNLAYVIYTSGSTGKPKGAMLAHRGIVNRLQWMQDTYKLTPQDRVLQKTPYSFDVSVWEFFWPLMYGATLVVARPRGHQDSAYLVKIISEQRITTMHFVPSMLQVFLREKGLENCRSLRQVICSGEALPAETESRFYAALKADLHNLYGPTEASIDVTYWACERESKRRLVPIGRPIANTRVYVLDQQKQPVPIGVPGELYLGGVALARGYHARPDLTAERFVPDPFSIAQGARLYRTGDLTRYLAGGEIEFLGRTDHQVKVRGFRVELGEIEAALGSQAGVRDCVVVAREVTTADQRLVAYIAGDKINVAELRQKLREQLPEYMVPSAFVWLDELPLTPNGKVDRKQLPAPEQIAIDEHHVSEQPRSPVTEVLAGICEQLLGIQDINIHANFFDLGGHSLLAMQVISRLNDAFNLEAPLYALFESPTVAALAQHVEVLLAGSQAAPAIPLVPASREGTLPLSDQQRRLWFLSQLEPDNPFYNMAGTLRLRGPLDVHALEWSFGELVQRHEVLRTTFPEVDGDPVQVVAPLCLKNRESWLDRVSTGSDSELVGDQHDTHGFDQVATAPCTDPIQARLLLLRQSVAPSTGVMLPLIDLATLPNDEKEKTLESLLREEAQRPFDLKRGPLLRLRLLRLSEDEHVLLLAMHHIISDGWSTGVLLRDLKSFYESRIKGTPAELPSLPVQYADYAAWQELRAADHNEQLEYWVDRLADVPDVLALPTDYSRSAASSGGAVSFAIPAELSADLKALGRREGATLFMTLMAGFQALLVRHSGQTRFAVGTPVAGRQRPELQDLIGFFVNTLALPADLSGDPSFVELLQRVRAEALAAYAHQEAPFERVVERLQPTRALDRAPLFQVMLALDN
ncbi:MAG TPA: amino acid adenylation domain-containing protein, partial [Pyrinomonadaceae bacterium]|nr:amino acid adenylation domain-containing protein [Pyrinomonadaceae bacterium]